MIYYLILVLAVLIVMSIYFLFKNKINDKKQVVLKALSLVLAVCFFIRYFASSGSLLDGVVNLSYNNPFESDALCAVVAILVWFTIASVVIVAMLPFFKYDILKNYAKTFVLFTSLLDIIFLRQLIYSYTGTYEITLCGVFMSIEVAILFCYSLYIFLSNHYFKMTKKQVIEALIALPLVLVLSIPPYMPQLFFGNFGSQALKGLVLYHRIYIYLTIIFLLVMYFGLKRIKDKEYIRMGLLFISLVALISYCYDYDFARFLEPTRWPLHLCNTAMFIIPICLMFKLDKLFYFTLFINVLGAFLAMLIPNYNDTLGFFSPSAVRFWLNHSLAFSMPLLIILLKIYQRPRLREFKYSMIGFLIYFVAILIINAWFYNYNTSVDFFFLNSDFIVDKLGTWAEHTRDIVWQFTIGGLTFTFYPLYQFLFFLVYVVLGLGMWFLYTWIFGVQDFYTALSEKNRKIKLDEIYLCKQYNVKEVYACMNTESVDKLVVKNVYKRYGNNKYYSVSDVSLQVRAGEIFGFLGPNGAGKSTLIKCIVGIQPTTSGSIEINGYDIARQPELTKEQFGFVPDHYALYENLTGREFINYIADLYGVDQTLRDERIKKYVGMLNLADAFDNKINTYSHGMKQKIAIISALVHNPKLWILDEPLTGLDPNSIYQVKECMKEHAQNGNIVFFSSHIIDIVEKLCDRIMIIKKGQIVESIYLDELKEMGVSLEEFYLKTINEAQVDASKSLVVENQIAPEPAPSKFFEIKPKKEKKNKRAKIKNKNATNKADVDAELELENIATPKAENDLEFDDKAVSNAELKIGNDLVGNAELNAGNDLESDLELNVENNAENGLENSRKSNSKNYKENETENIAEDKTESIKNYKADVDGGQNASTTKKSRKKK